MSASDGSEAEVGKFSFKPVKFSNLGIRKGLSQARLLECFLKLLQELKNSEKLRMRNVEHKIVPIGEAKFMEFF